MAKKLKVALVHDYLAEFGGAERVLEALHEVFPEAPVYTAFLDKQRLGAHWQRMQDWDIRQSWLSKIPFHQQLFSPLRIFAPQYFRSFDLSEYDLVISSTNAYFAKAVKVPNGKHLCYCHTPSRSLWGYTTMSDWQKNPLTKFFGILINHYLRVVDYYLAQDVDLFIANSKETQKRIKKFYRRDSKVIYPPVNIPAKISEKSFKKSKKDSEVSARNSIKYYLYVNRLALAKHPELAIEVCNQLKLPLKIVGEGKLRGRLEEMAGPTIEFLGHVADEELPALYSGARALIYPVEDEDFGIVPVEAMGYGVPVIAHASGGPLETVLDGKTGTLFSHLTTEDLKKAIEKFQKSKFSRANIHQFASKFSKKRFQAEISILH